MKPFAPLLTFAALLASLPVIADDNLSVNAPGGFVDSGDLTLTGTIQFGGANADGNTSAGSTTSSNGYYTNVPLNAYATINSLFLPTGRTIDSVVFYNALFSYGGWFGVYGAGPDGVDTNYQSTLSAAALFVPLLQYTTGNPFDGSSQWITVDNTNDYLSQLTGATIANPNGTNVPTSVATTFTLNTPITGATAIRLVGPAGGTAYTQPDPTTTDGAYNAGFVSGYEFEVLAAPTPEPSTYAMLFGGIGMLVLIARYRSKLSA